LKDNKTFNYLDYYSTYPNAVISRLGYPARAAYKSSFWSLKRKIVGGGNHICLCKSRHQS
jgi:hypothetical protein